MKDTALVVTKYSSSESAKDEQVGEQYSSSKRGESRRTVEAKRLGIIIGIISIVAVVVGGAICWYVFLRPPRYLLQAASVDKEPVINGKDGDSVWKEAEETIIPIEGGAPVTLKAVYTKKKVFFLATYKDSTKNDVDEVWEYDGQKWKVGPTADELSLFFDIGDSIIGFQEKGFAVMNRGFDPGGKIYDVAMVAKAPSERGSLWKGYKQKGDVWELNAGLTTFYGKAHDMQFKVDPSYMRFADTYSTASASVFRDSYDSGVPFVRNQLTAWTSSSSVSGVAQKGDWPLYMLSPGLTIENTPYPTEDQMVEITDYSIFNKGDKIPRTIFVTGQTWGGSMDDIDGRASWSNGIWTVEMGRKLNTGHDDDIVFKTGDNKSYSFGVLVRADGRTIRPSPPATLRFAPQESR